MTFYNSVLYSTVMLIVIMVIVPAVAFVSCICAVAKIRRSKMVAVDLTSDV